MDPKLSCSTVTFPNTRSFGTSLFGTVEARSIHTLLRDYLCPNRSDLGTVTGRNCEPRNEEMEGLQAQLDH